MTKRIDNGIDQKTGECVRGCCEGDTSGVAVPELLQAAQQADAYIRFVIYEGKLPNVDAMPLLKLRAAIAKAEGRD